MVDYEKSKFLCKENIFNPDKNLICKVGCVEFLCERNSLYVFKECSFCFESTPIVSQSQWLSVTNCCCCNGTDQFGHYSLHFAMTTMMIMFRIMRTMMRMKMTMMRITITMMRIMMTMMRMMMTMMRINMTMMRMDPIPGILEPTPSSFPLSTSSWDSCLH